MRARGDFGYSQTVGRENDFASALSVKENLGQRAFVMRNVYEQVAAVGVYIQMVGDVSAVKWQSLIYYISERQLLGERYELLDFSSDLNSEIAEQIAPFNIGSAPKREGDV